MRRTVLYLAPLIWTSQGHKNIAHLVKLACVRANANFVPVFTLTDDVIQKAWAGQPALTIVDWPEHSIRGSIYRLASGLRGERWTLMMHTKDVGKPRTATGYDRVIAIEPNIPAQLECDLGHTAITTTIPPLVNGDNVGGLTDDETQDWSYATAGAYKGKHNKTILVMQTGNWREQEYLMNQATDVVTRAAGYWTHIGSASLPQPAVRFARLADVVIASPGYSTFWELAAMNQLAKARWIPLSRELEDFSARIASAIDPTGEAASLLAAVRDDPWAGVNALASMIDDYMQGVGLHGSDSERLGSSAEG